MGIVGNGLVLSGAPFIAGYVPTPTLPVNINGSALFTVTPSQYLSIPNNAAFTQNTAFTCECWFRPTNTTGGYVWAMLQRNWICVKYSGSKFLLDMSYVGNPPGYSTANRTYGINTWYHLALTWTGAAGKLYVNGIQEWTFTGAGGTVADGQPLLLGQYQGQNQPTPLGYTSNFRYVKGVAVYTAPFTVPTQPFAATQDANVNGNPSAAITGTQTSLLLNTFSGANFLKDNSTNNFTVTNFGAVTSNALNPF